MSFEERNTWIGLVISLGIAWYFGTAVLDGMASGRFDGPDGLAVWARTVLWMIPAGIVAMIVGTILGSILTAVITRDENPDMTSDERDRFIGTWGLRASVIVSSLAFVGGLVTLALGWDVLPTLNLMLAGFWAGAFVEGLVKIAIYRGLV